MKLENWSVVATDYDDPYKAPELFVPKLKGEVYGHPKFEDGLAIVTSAIESMENKTTVITRSGSRYKLGKVDPEYQKIYPDALKRLQQSFKLIKARKNK